MDRRQRKTREAIFKAFTDLLSLKGFDGITVSEIIEKADVGRATFYAHFETKDFLLKELCEELFCHIFDQAENCGTDHRHIFDCDSTETAILHLFRHLQRNDNNILALLSSQNNDLFLRYFRRSLEELFERQVDIAAKARPNVPALFWQNHVVSTFIETLRWWLHGGMKESPEEITAYFLSVL